MDKNDLAKIVDSRIPATSKVAKPQIDPVSPPATPRPLESYEAPDEADDMFSSLLSGMSRDVFSQTEETERRFRKEITDYVLRVAERAENGEEEIMSHYLFRRLDELSWAVDHLRAVCESILSTDPETIIKRYKD